MSSISFLPKISIVTPSFNQGQFLEHTIRSVIDQKYSNLEYIIIDGGSTDNSIEIIKKYSDKIYCWVSEPDNGQAHAINKGLKLASGDILAYLNSDDIYLPGALDKIVEAFKNYPDVGMVYGNRFIINEAGDRIGMRRSACYVPGQLAYYSGIPQETAFWRKSVTEAIGFFNEEFHFCMDREYWVRISKQFKIKCIDEYTGAFRVHSASKTETQQERKMKEDKLISEQYYPTGLISRKLFFVYLRAYKTLYKLQSFFF